MLVELSGALDSYLRYVCVTLFLNEVFMKQGKNLGQSFKDCSYFLAPFLWEVHELPAVQAICLPLESCLILSGWEEISCLSYQEFWLDLKKFAAVKSALR